VKQKRRKSITELSQERVSPALIQEIGKIELIITTEEAERLLYVRATRARCELAFQWGKALTFMLGLFKLLRWWA
jgi:hypothetical protein